MENNLLEEAERLLSSLVGVGSVRISLTGDRKIGEIHVLATAGVKAKQVVRNVESALEAELGISIDHRKISVAQRREPHRATPQPSVSETPNCQLRIQVDHLEYGLVVEPFRRICASVTLQREGHDHTGKATGKDHPGARLQLLSEATIRSVESLLYCERNRGVTFELLGLDTVGVELVQAFNERCALAIVKAVIGLDVTLLCGSAVCRTSPENAVAVATLRALRPWIQFRSNLNANFGASV